MKKCYFISTFKNHEFRENKRATCLRCVIIWTVFHLLQKCVPILQLPHFRRFSWFDFLCITIKFRHYVLVTHDWFLCYRFCLCLFSITFLMIVFYRNCNFICFYIKVKFSHICCSWWQIHISFYDATIITSQINRAEFRENKATSFKYYIKFYFSHKFLSQ